jgi:hypothetical protein
MAGTHIRAGLFPTLFLCFISIMTDHAGAVSTHSFVGCGLPGTGVTQCYNAAGVSACPVSGFPEQDGEHSPSFAPSYTIFARGGGSVTVDNRTGLMWVTDPTAAGIGGTYFWSAGVTTCYNLSYAGYSDWHLPNIRELQSIVDYTRQNPAIDVNFFYNIQSNYYRSSTTLYTTPALTSYGLYVDFSDGHIGYTSKMNTGTAYYITCVRAGAP